MIIDVSPMVSYTKADAEGAVCGVCDHRSLEWLRPNAKTNKIKRKETESSVRYVAR